MLLEEMYSLTDRELLPRFIQLCADPQKAQEKILKDILTANAESAFGRQYGFTTMADSRDFTQNIPVTEWDDVKAMSKAMEQGEADQLFMGQPKYFIVTSGTTGNSKYLPESILGAKAKSLTSRLRQIAIVMNNPSCLAGHIFPISNSAGIGKVACGIPYGYASGVTLMETSEALQKKIAYPLAVLTIEDQASLDYALMRFSIEHDVTSIVGNNAGRMEKLILMAQENAEAIIKDIETGELTTDNIAGDIREQLAAAPNPERAEELKTLLRQTGNFTPAQYWPNLTVFSCWLGGSVGRYLESAKNLFGKDVQFFDFGYGASEGKFNIPLKNNEAAGPLSLAAAFYEFESPDDGAILQAHEVQDKQEYSLVITTFSGLYRYRLHDIVKVEGFTGKTPNIRFMNKSKDIGNICGEKLSGQFIVDTVEQFFKENNIALKHFCAVADEAEGRYDICVEFSESHSLDAQAASELDKGLKKAVVYNEKRKQQLLQCPRLIIMKPGWQDSLYQEKTQNTLSITQIKLPVIYSAIPCGEYVLECLKA